MNPTELRAFARLLAQHIPLAVREQLSQLEAVDLRDTEGRERAIEIVRKAQVLQAYLDDVQGEVHTLERKETR